MYLKLLLNTVIHCIDVRLIHCHAFLRKRGCVVDRYVLKLRVRFPIFIKNQKQLLCSSKGEGRNQDLTTLSIDHSIIIYVTGHSRIKGTWTRESQENNKTSTSSAIGSRNQINSKIKTRQITTNLLTQVSEAQRIQKTSSSKPKSVDPSNFEGQKNASNLLVKV